jgi:hypothetical protein
MLEPKCLSLFGRRSERKPSRRGCATRDAAAYVEQLEPRRVLTAITPVVAVTHYDGSVQSVSGFTGPLYVSSVAGFTSTGDLFVETTTGVATIHYTGLDTTTNANAFTGCSVVTGDPYNVGAGDTTGHLDLTLPAVFQATNQTFTVTVPNQTGSSVNLNYSMYWQSVPKDGDAANFYALAAGNKFENFSTVGNGAALPDFSVAASGTTTITLPYMPINAGRIYFSTGTSSPLTAKFDSTSSTWSAGQPTPAGAGSFQGIYDYFELTMDASGVNNTTSGSGTQYLPTCTIDTTQVDQFGIPMTLSGSSNNGASITQLTSGVTLSEVVARDAIINQFSALHPSGSDPYSELVLPASSQSQGLPLRIVNPGKMTIQNTDPLGYLFDATLQQLFETSAGDFTLTDGTDTYTFTHTSVMAEGNDSAMHSYNVLAITGPGITGTAYIYEPFFSTNAPSSPSMSPVDYSTRPPAPKWLSSAAETAGEMIFGNDGVFSDYGAQLVPGSTTTKYDATTAGTLAGLENQVVSAINRGVVLMPTSDWSDPTKFYTTGTFNEYAQFLHQQQISGTPIMIGGNAYAFGYDDQGGNSTTLSLLDQNGASVTLGPWTASGNNIGFLAAVYHDVLARAVDPAGQTYWLGQLSDGVSRTQVSLAIVTSLESHTDIIKGFYTDLLHRAADTPGLNSLLNLFAQGYTQADIKSVFYGSEEYFQTRGGGTNAGFLDALYQDELNRAPDSGGQTYYTQLLADGHSRGDVASLLMEGQEAIHDVVQSYYQTYLSRPADDAGLAYWTSVLQVDNRYSVVQSALLGSDEFYQR